MKNLLFLFSVLFVSFSACSQVIPEQKTVNWKLAGLRNFESNSANFIDFHKIGGDASGLKSNDILIKNLLDSFKEIPVTIYFPQGKYLFNQSIRISGNVTLKGASSDSAILIFDLVKEEHAIRIEGNISKTESLLVKDIYKDSSTILAEDASLFSPGDFIKITENDEEFITSTWAKGYTGQIVQIAGIEGNIIQLSSPLRRNFHIGKGVKMLKINVAKNVGIETLKIERRDATKDQTSNIIFKYAANCYVKCIESVNCNFSHIELNGSTNISVTGNYLHHAFDYGNGGKGYGVLVHLTSGESLIKDNIFNNLRHSMLLQAGANGNVFAYNYSVNPVWTGVMLPANASGDLVLHGNYSYANLFEGNVVQNIVIDNSHGKNGPNNTFFRNRAELYGLVMNNNAGDEQAFIGNEITNNGMFMGMYSLSGTNNYEYGNNRKGNLVPSGINSLNEKSLFLDDAPQFYQNQSTWPPIGFPNDLNKNIIEAQALFQTGVFTPCANFILPKDTIKEKDTVEIITDTTSAIDSTSTSVFLCKNLEKDIKIFPNPATDFLYIESKYSAPIKYLGVLNSAGKEIILASNENKINVETLQNGLYFLKIKFSDDTTAIHKFIVMKN